MRFAWSYGSGSVSTIASTGLMMGEGSYAGISFPFGDPHEAWVFSAFGERGMTFVTRLLHAVVLPPE
jgi:hypothetical protein